MMAVVQESYSEESWRSKMAFELLAGRIIPVNNGPDGLNFLCSSKS